MKSASRIDAVVATLVGVLALAVSAYTAYIQRQQVRAQVYPILELGTGNDPVLNVTLANKGVGPALIKHAVVRFDGQPVRTWDELMTRMAGPGEYAIWQSSFATRPLSPGEELHVFELREKGRAAEIFNRARFRIGVEICYCSTLGDCWTFVKEPTGSPSTDETRRCPAPSAITFQQ